MRMAILAAMCALALKSVQADSERDVRMGFACRSWFYEDVKDLLVPGDVVYGFAARRIDRSKTQAGGCTASTFDRERFVETLAELEAIEAEGIKRVIVLSSYADLEAEIENLPEWIDKVTYNSERGMTPMEELRDLAQYVPRFAELAHQHGFNMGWGPTSHMLNRTPELFELAGHVDSFGLQHQKILQSQGLEAFVALTRERYMRIKAVNGDCEVNVQVVLERTPAPQAVEAFLAAQDYIDRAGVWTMRDKQGVREVLEGLAGLREPGGV